MSDAIKQIGLRLQGLRESLDMTQEIFAAKCNIPVGAELVFIEDPTVKVIVESERKVSYNNEITSLSAVAGRIKGVKAIAGPSYFTYNGKLVCDIAKETQWKE